METPMRTIMTERLTRAAFEDFGTLIEASEDIEPIAINAGTCQKFANLALPDCGTAGGKTSIHIYRAKPLYLPIIVRCLEHHASGSQTFVPLSGRPYLVVVAPAGDFDLEKVRVFRAEGSQGVQYKRGTWHHFCLALDAESDFLVIDRLSSTPDCEEVQLSADQQFVIAL
jgi:ureidoglycolate lyase